MRTVALVILVALVVLGISAWVFVNSWSIGAANPPGALERIIASHTKKFFVERAAGAGLPQESASNADSISNGHTIYGGSCAGCHGYDGRTPTTLGRSMSPQAPSLAEGGAQSWSNGELFVIVRDGLRMTGMPAFGSTEKSDEIWDLVHYIRSIPSTAPRH
jgi:mono/diheme cytochrome c family protein